MGAGSHPLSPAQDHCSCAIVSCVPALFIFLYWVIPITINHAVISPTFKTNNRSWIPYPFLALFLCSFQQNSLKGMGLLSPLPFLPLSHINLFTYLFLAVLGLRCCVQAFPSCSEWGLLFVAVLGLLTTVASHHGGFSLLRGTGCRRAGFSSCGTPAQ